VIGASTGAAAGGRNRRDRRRATAASVPVIQVALLLQHALLHQKLQLRARVTAAHFKLLLIIGWCGRWSKMN